MRAAQLAEVHCKLDCDSTLRLQPTASPCLARGSDLCAIENWNDRPPAPYYSVAHYWAARNGSPKIDDSPWDNIDADWIHQRPGGRFATRATLDLSSGELGFALPAAPIDQGHEWQMNPAPWSRAFGAHFPAAYSELIVRNSSCPEPEFDAQVFPV